MQHIKNLFQKPVAAARRKKIRFFSPFLAIYGASLIVLLVLATGCDTRNEKADTSGTDNPETVSRSDTKKRRKRTAVFQKKRRNLVYKNKPESRLPLSNLAQLTVFPAK